MITPSPRSASRVVCAVALTLLAGDASAQSVQECVDWHKTAQDQRRLGRLLSARDSLVRCANQTCPSLIRTECAQWLSEVSAAIPSVVVAARDPDGRDLWDVRVFVDGKQVAARADGRPIELDPGQHVFRYEARGLQPIGEAVVLREGEKNRSLAARWSSWPGARDAKPAAVVSTESDRSTPRDRPTPPMVYVLGAIGIAGLGTAAFFEARGLSRRSDLDDSQCKPNCSQADVDAAQRDMLVGDIVLGASIVSLGVAGYLFWTRPTVSAETAPQAAIWMDLHPTSTGAAASVAGTF